MVSSTVATSSEETSVKSAEPKKQRPRQRLAYEKARMVAGQGNAVKARNLPDDGKSSRDYKILVSYICFEQNTEKNFRSLV